MARVLNPETGLYEDDGTGLPETTATPALPDGLTPTLPTQAEFAAGGGASPAPATPPPAAPAAPAAMVPVIQPKPERESHDTQVIKSAETKAADKKLGQAYAREDAAMATDAALKVKEAEIKAEDARTRSLMEERRKLQLELAESEKKKKVEENLAADRAAVEASAQDEQHKNSAGNVAGAGGIFAALMGSIGDVGKLLQVRNKNGTTPAGALAGPNMVDDAWEKMRQRKIAKALADFNGNERIRKLEKEGRGAELEILRDRLLTGINNEFDRDMRVQEALVNERLARLSPATAKAASDLLSASTAGKRAVLERENTQRYERTHASTIRQDQAPKGGAAANKALSGDTAELVDASESYDRLALRQRELIEQNGGSFPVTGPNGEEFEKNETVLKSLLQKKFGKSDNDAKLAAEQQGTPGLVGTVLSKLPFTNTVENYKRSLAVNGDQLRFSAQNRVKLEGPDGVNARKTGHTTPVASAGPPKNPKQGEKFTDSDGDTFTWNGSAWE
jgi:hypothetical protein